MPPTVTSGSCCATVDGTLTLELAARPRHRARRRRTARAADVTIALDYTDAAALATGTLSPAEALTAGRIRVRGDLSVLAAGQELLAAARDTPGTWTPTPTF